MIGQIISQYEIVEKLGEGGMGVVYKAHDTKLDRFVALKFLPPHLAASEQDKARFVQEAKAAAALNHPNVCSIIDIQENDKQLYIVMEFVDGQTLREKIGVMNLKQAIDAGMQIADGLAAAHEKGIVHRDIKPENIMVRKDGICQIMDFGLAKLRTASSKINRLTRDGSTVGTAGYMAPEAVQGQDADHRGDIFSLGVVLYELFTGEIPFKGLHETALMYEIVNVDPSPMSAVKPEIDPNLDAIVMECLAKEPSDRYQSAAEVAKELRRFKRESSRSHMSRVTAVRDIPPRSTIGEHHQPLPAFAATSLWHDHRLNIVVGLAGLFFLTTIGMVILNRRQPIGEAFPVHFTVSAPEKGALQGQPPVLSPDGLKLAFVAFDSSGKSSIWLRPLSALEPIQLKGTEEATFPFWSPDSRFIAFFQSSKLKKIEASGGPAQTIADAGDGRGGTWSSSGVIVFAPNYNTGLQQVSDAGGTPTQVTVLDSARKEDSHRWPSFLPDGRHFLYMARSVVDEKTGIMVGSLDSKEMSPLLSIRSNAVYASPGFLLFVREQSLMAEPFDAGSGKITGEAVPISENVGFDQNFYLGLFSASANGSIALSMGSGSKGIRQLVWIDRNGKHLEKAGTAGLNFDFSISPDEKKVAMRRIDPQSRNHDLWMVDLMRGTESRFTFRPCVDDDPVWSPDGTTIYFDSNPIGTPNIHRKPTSGLGSEELVLNSPISNVPLSCSPDGRNLLYVSTDPKTKEDLWILPLTGDKKPYPYIQTDASEYSGQFSPDGRWIAYGSNESGKFEVYVQSFPATQGKWQVSTSGGGHPVWSKNGKELFYLAPDKKLMAVDVTLTGSSFEQGIPKPLFIADVDNYVGFNRFVVSKDAKKFLVEISTDETNAKPIMVMLNWNAEMKKK
jgi:eukaryotic-like serine/threonine-protein kinase